MARFGILSKDGKSVRFEGKPRYIGTYLKPSYLEFSEIASPTPIAWEVGDYVDYPRTGMRYYLYSIPQPSKNARKGSHGRAFTYSNVQLHAATKELEIALFRDLVSNDNNIHFSTSPDVATFEDVHGIARRIQACMDDLYPGRWEIRVADFDANADAEIIEKISTAKDFAMSGGTCLDALSKIYELWQDIGWMHSYENGKEVITIGYANRRIAENTTDPYVYGKGNGLTAIRKNHTNKDEFATRLYVYGSERNLPARYYNGLDILNSESVDIRHLMIPLDSWGKTDGKPDAHKAYLENVDAVAKYGVIPKVHYFDSVDSGADIYPSIEGVTIGQIRKALDDMGSDKYYPTESAYPDSDLRVDEVRFCDNPDDDGLADPTAIQSVEKEYAGESRTTVDTPGGATSQFIIEDKLILSNSFSLDKGRACEVVFKSNISGFVEDNNYNTVAVRVSIKDASGFTFGSTKTIYATKNGEQWDFELPEVKCDYAKSPLSVFNANVYLTIEATLPTGNSSLFGWYTLNSGTATFSIYPIQEKTFVIRLHELGFNIDEMASRGKGKTISMKTGACAGRNFEIVSSRHKGGILSAPGYWDITCRRQLDKTLGLMFPNSSYEVVEGDRFVLLDIAMPEIYIRAQSWRLLEEGQKLLARASRVESLYEPSIDAKVMTESGRTLREGMIMQITDEDVVDNTTDYIIIDTLSIHEDESAIPTYKVTLKERRKVTYKGTPSATSTTDTESVEDDTDEDVNVDLSDYYKKGEVDSKVGEVSDRVVQLESMWRIEDGKLVTTLPVHIKNNLFLDGDEASEENGEDNTKGTVRGIRVSSSTILYPESDGIINMAEFFSELSFDVDLSGYYTKEETLSITNGLSDRIGSIEALIGEDKDTIEGTIDTFYEIEHFLSNIGNTTLENIISQLAPKTTKISAGTGLTGGGDLSDDITLSLAKVGTAGTYAKVVVDAYGRVTGSASLGTGDIPTIAISKVSGLQAALDNKVGIAGDQTITGAKTFSALATFNKGMVITGDVTINGNLFLTGDEASMRDGGSGTGGGITEEYLENYLRDNDYIYGTVNGGRWANNIYAPISAGTSGQVLVSRGSTSTPGWEDVADLGISGGTFEGGALSNNIWFTLGSLGIVTATSKFNVIRGTDDEVMVGSGSIPSLLLRASNTIATVFGINTAMRQRDGHTDLFAKTIIDPKALFSYENPLTGFTDQDDWSMFVRGNVGVYGGINFYNGIANPYFRAVAVGNLMTIFAYDVPTSTEALNVLSLSSYGFSMLWRGLQLRLSNDSQKTSALRFYDETDGTQQFLGIDASKNLIYNSNIVLHSGNYTDYITGGGADLSDYYTKTESDARYFKSTGGTVNGNLAVRGNLSVSDNPLWLYNGSAQWQIQPSVDNGLRISSADKVQMFIDYDGNLTLEGGATFGGNVDIGNKYILNSNTLTGISFVSPFTSEGCLAVIQDGAQPQLSLASAGNEVYFKWSGYQLSIGQRTSIADNASIALNPSLGQIVLGSSTKAIIPKITLQSTLGTTSISMYNGQLTCGSMVILHEGNYAQYIGSGGGGTGEGISESAIETYDLRGEYLIYSTETMEYLLENGVKNGTHIFVNVASADLTYFKHIVPRAWKDSPYINTTPSCEVIIQCVNKTLTVPNLSTSGIGVVNPTTGALATSATTIGGYIALRLIWHESAWMAHRI